MKLHWFLITLAILGLLMGVLFGTGVKLSEFLTSGSVEPPLVTPENGGPVIKYYGYGDSISSREDMYVVQMQEKYDPGAVSSHNTDGGGRTSCWGLETIDRHYSRNMSFFIYMFTNDQFHGLSPETTAFCYLGIYEYVSRNGTVPVPVIGPLRNQDIPEQLNYTEDLQISLEMMGIPYVRMYDALDSIPGNGVEDDIVLGNYEDGTHPDHEAHAIMADYLWAHPVHKG